MKSPSSYSEPTACARKGYPNPEEPDRLGRVLVLGLGKSGKSVSRYCAGLLGSRVDSLFIAAGAETDDSRAFVESLAGPGVDFAFGDDALSGDRGRFDVCIASPGIPCWHDLYVRGSQLSFELISEIEFSWRESAADSVWVAVTGTNGKTTTTSCIAQVLADAGLAASAVGNIGDVCLDAVQAGKTEVYVAEVSSYQLYSTSAFAPDVAVMLNITPDHLHWHQTLDAYRDAKFKMLDNMAAAGRGIAVMDAVNDVVRAKVRQVKGLARDQRGYDYIPMGTADGIYGDMRAKCGAENAAFLEADGTLHVALGGVDHALLKASELLVPGEHNASNALAAAAAAVALGVSDDAISAALATFAPLEHRIEPCGTVRGAACYNDSKATNVDATVKALAAFPAARVIVLLGGDDKDTDLTELIAATHAHARLAVLFGAARQRFSESFAAAAGQAPDGFALLEAQGMEEALDAALDASAPGDVVLLSPACASFDEFTSFEHRGRAFKQLVEDRMRSRGA